MMGQQYTPSQLLRQTARTTVAPSLRTEGNIYTVLFQVSTRLIMAEGILSFFLNISFKI